MMQTNELIFATHNANKTKEIKALLPGFYIQSLSDIKYVEDIPETGTTLEENALIKARTIFEKTGKACFADDTGLEVVVLGGAPGVYSARYAGENADSEMNMDKLLAELDAHKNREARFRTVIAYLDGAGNEKLFEGTVQGSILPEKRGGQGFGYDPLFLPFGKEKSFAEMTSAQKNELSHRARAIQKFIEYLRA